MISKQKILLKLILTCISLFFFAEFVHPQSNLEKKIDVQFENTNLVSAIKIVSTLSEVNFTYNPSIIPGKTITGSFQDQSIKYILADILSGLEISFVELSGQIILYRPDEGFGFLPKRIAELSQDTLPAKELPQIKIPVFPPKKTETETADTIFIHHYDTVYFVKHDTIVRIQKDTLVVEIIKTDTIILQDTATVFDKIYLNQAKKNHDAWFSAELSFSYQPNINYTITDDDNQLFSESLSERIKISKVQGYSIMAQLNAQFSRFSVQTGLGINQLTQHFEHINESFGGYNVNDTIETYYTLQNTDTNWVYVTEERWIETSEIIKNTTKVNSQSLHIPLILGYSIRVKNFSFELGAGFHTEIPLQREISVYFDTTNFSMSEEYDINNLRLKIRSLSFSYSASLSINYLLNKNLCFVIRPYYYANITSFYRKGEPLQQKNSYLSIYLGLRYYFRTNYKNRRN
jgi:hypothetical protein